MASHASTHTEPFSESITEAESAASLLFLTAGLPPAAVFTGLSLILWVIPWLFLSDSRPAVLCFSLGLSRAGVKVPWDPMSVESQAVVLLCHNQWNTEISR